MRYTVTKGDFGWRIYDRLRKDYIKSSPGLVRCYATKQAAQRALKRLS